MPAKPAVIHTIELPAEGLSTSQYRELMQTLREWEDEVRAAITRYPAKSYELGIAQTEAFLRMLGLLGQDMLPPSGLVGPTKPHAVTWLENYTLHEVDGALDRYLDEIRNAILYGLRGTVNPTQVASWLYKATRDAEVNWRTIARTEMVRANSEGRLDACEAMGYEQVWFPPHTGACKACKRLIENKVFPISQIRGATNFGRQPRDWIACCPLHPHCRHVPLPHVADVYDEAQRQYRALEDNGLDDQTLDEMFDSSGHLKAKYRNDPRLAAYFETIG